MAFDIDQLMRLINNTGSTPLNGYDYQTALVLDEMSTVEYEAAEWTIRQFAKGEIAKDPSFPVGSRPRIVEERVYNQAPYIKNILVVRWDSSQTAIKDLLPSITKPWFCLTGQQGANAINAADWIETQKDKIQIVFEEDPQAAESGGSFYEIVQKGYAQSFCFYHHQAGTISKSCSIKIENGVATLKTNSVAAVKTYTISGVADSDLLSISYGSVTASFTVPVSGTDTQARDGLKAALDGETGFTDDFTIEDSNTDGIKITAKNPGKDFTFTLSAKITETVDTQNSDIKHHRRSGDYVFIKGADTSVCNGYFLIDTVPDTDVVTFKIDVNNGDDANNGSIVADFGFMAPGAAWVSNRLAYDLGTVDYYHHDIIGIEPTPLELISTDFQAKLTELNISTFQELQLNATLSAGKRLVNGGKAPNGKWIKSVLVGRIWYPLEWQRAAVSYLVSGETTEMTDSFLSGFKLAVDEFSESAKKKGLTGEFQKNLAMYPETEGFPPGYKPGDHYINTVPLVSDVSTEDRQNHQVNDGVEYHVQTIGGVKGMTVYGNYSE